MGGSFLQIFQPGPTILAVSRGIGLRKDQIKAVADLLSKQVGEFLQAARIQ